MAAQSKLSASSPPAAPAKRSGSATKTTTVDVQIDLASLPPLSSAEETQLRALAARGDDEIDYVDIPPLTEAFWNSAVANPFFKPRKMSTTVRIDADVLAWLKLPGKGYQSRINAILRREMLEALKS